MSFRGEDGFRHGQEERVGVLLVNLGTPAAPTPAALRPYLRQFLGDPRVVEAPRWLWQPFLNLVIVPTRSRRSARAYRSVWTEEGSPLLVISRAQQAALARRLSDEPAEVELGMSYGEPSIRGALRRLADRGCRRLLVVPLYPQYSGCTTGSVFADVAKELGAWRWVPELRFIGHYFDSPGYVDALAGSIKSFWDGGPGQPDRLVFSFHGTPVDYLAKGDPYHCQCQGTARLAAERLGLADDRWTVTFQSRFGRKEWLRPYTDRTLERLAADGVRSVHVVCPAFAADCLETLEEIDGENREIFLGAGGKEFGYIPALNDRESHIDFLEGLVRSNTGDWLERARERNRPERLRAQAERHQAGFAPTLEAVARLSGRDPG